MHLLTGQQPFLQEHLGTSEEVHRTELNSSLDRTVMKWFTLPPKTGCYEQMCKRTLEICAFALYSCGILTALCHRH